MTRRIELIVKYAIPGVAILISIAAPLLSDTVPDITILSGLVALLILYLGFVYQQLSSGLAPVTQFVDHRAIAEAVRESNFYDRFQVDVRNARQRVFISYFDNTNPLESNDSDTVRYYKEIEEITKAKASEDVEFRRIVRAIPQLDSWIRRMLDVHEGDPNFSMVCVKDMDPAASLKSHVSVQLIDDNITYFVAVGEQRETSQPRDSYIRSEDLNTQWSRYYDRIWDDSLLLIDRGRINEPAIEEYEEHLERIDDEYQ